MPLVLELEEEQRLLLSRPTCCATAEVGQHSCWVADTGVGNIQCFLSITHIIQCLGRELVLDWGWHLCQCVVPSPLC